MTSPQIQESLSKLSKYPRGDCYRQVILKTSLFSSPDPNLPTDYEIFVVHGRPKLTRPSYTRYGHAWLEWKDPDGVEWVYDAITEKVVVKVFYYKLGTIQHEELYRYTVDQAQAMCVKFKHYGPWEGRYGCPPVAKCRRRRK